MKQKLLPLVLYMLLVAFTSEAIAGVVLKNGNFYISYTDYKYCAPGKGCFEITRTYNSKSADVTEFGFGWGWDLATKVYFGTDGVFRVHHNGGGAVNYFFNVVPAPSKTAEMVETLVTTGLKHNYKQEEPVVVLEWKNDLYSSFRERINTWYEFVKKGWLEKPKPMPGVYEYEDAYRNTAIVLEDGSVELSSRCNCDSGQFKKMVFDANGRLVKEIKSNDELLDENDAQFTAFYNEDDHPYLILFADDSIHIEYNGQFITHIWGKDGEAFIEVNERKDLVGCREYDFSNYNRAQADSFIYTHEYDALHNMTRIAYTDGSDMKIVYNNKGMASLINVRDTLITHYHYDYFTNAEDGSINTNHYYTRTTIIRERDTSTAYYEYKSTNNAEGSIYLEWLIVETDNVRTETYYNEFGKPEKIIRNGMLTTFTYDRRRNLIKKDGNKFVYTIAYRGDKPIRIERFNCETLETTVYDYTYNANGQVAYTKLNGVTYRNTFDNTGKIVLTTVGKEELKYEYLYGSSEFPSHVFFTDGKELQLDYQGKGDLKCKHSNPPQSEVTEALFEVFQRHWKNTEPLRIGEDGNE
ncbi:MAG: hypothetical protein KIS94_06475 [Chitinophagales bacterium]|nr:hypothetical protein [Chitinophagales bacterium]